MKLSSHVSRFAKLFEGSKYYYWTTVQGTEKSSGKKDSMTYFANNNPKKKQSRTLEYPGWEIKVSDYFYHLSDYYHNSYKDHPGRIRGITLPPINSDDKCKYGAIDVDKYKEDWKLKKIIKQIIDEKLPLVPCFSKSLGLHLYIFSKDWISAYKMQECLKHFRRKLGLPKTTEKFPKQTELKPEKDERIKKVGNGITLPYRNCLRTNREEFNRYQTHLERIRTGSSVGTLEHPNPGKLIEEFRKVNPEWIKNEDLETGNLEEFLDNAESQVQDPSFFMQFPLTEYESENDKEINEKIEQLVEGPRNTDKELQTILQSIKDKKEHDKGGTFDNYVVDFVALAVGKGLEDSEILSQLNTIKDYSDKAKEDPEYFKKKIEYCRESFNKPDPKKARDEFLKEVAWNKKTENYVVLESGQEYGEKTIDMLYYKKLRKKPTKVFMFSDNRIMVEGEIRDPKNYDPDKLIIERGGLAYINTYKPSGLKAVQGEGEEARELLALWKELLEYLFPDKDIRRRVLDWLCWIVRNPGVKARYCLLVFSLENQVGKGTIFRVLTEIFGEDNVVEGSVKTIIDKGKTFVDKCLTLVDECSSTGEFSEKRNLVNDLKPIISEKRIWARSLYKDGRVVDNFSNIMIFTNNRDALSLSKGGDGRYFVIFHEAKRKDNSFYKRIHKLLDEGGSQYLYWELKNRKISDDFDPNDVAPKTEWLEAMHKISVHPLSQALQLLFNEKKWPLDTRRDIIGSTELWDYFQDKRKDIVKNYTQTQLSNALEHIGGVCLGQIKHKESDTNPTIWIIRNHDKYKLIKKTDICNKHWPQLFPDVQKINKMYEDTIGNPNRDRPNAVIKTGKIIDREKDASYHIIDKEDRRESLKE